MPPRRILVTGAAGFLGTHLCRRLVRDGFAGRLVALDSGRRDPASVPAGFADAVTTVSGDVRDPTVVARCLDDVDLVFHLAGVADPRACEREPALARAVNVGGTATLVGAAKGRRLVLLSSAVTYAPGAAETLDEDAPVLASGVYAETKLDAERLCLDAAAAGDLDAIVVRNFNTYGGGQAGVFLVPQLIEQAQRERRITVASCRAVRDFTHVDDTVAALAALGVGGAPGGIYNLGSGIAVSSGDVALTLGLLLDVPVSCAHRAPGTNPRLVADNARLRTATGWQPTIDLATGLQRTVAWYRERAKPA